MTPNFNNNPVELICNSPKDRTIGFTVYERVGTPLRGVSARQTADGTDWEPVFERLMNQEDLKDGLPVLVWFGHDEQKRDHWRTEIVTEKPTGVFRINLSEDCFRTLAFDETEGWVVLGLCNMKGIKRLEIFK